MKHMAAIGGGTAIGMLIGLITVPISTRIFPTDQYGIASLFSVYSNLAFMVCMLGLDQAFVRFYYTKEENEYRRSLLTACWAIPALLVVVGSVVALFLNGYWKFVSNELLVVFFVYQLVLVLNRLSLLQIRLEYRSRLFGSLTVIQKAANLLFILVAIYAVDANRNALVLILALLFSTALPTAVAMLAEKKRWRLSVDVSFFRDNGRELFKYGLPFIVSVGVTSVFQATDKLSLGYFSSLSEVGIYSSAMAIVSVFSIAQASFNTLWAPLSVEHFEKHPDDRSFFKQCNGMVTVVMFAFGATVVLFKDPIVLLLGERYREAAFILPFLCFYPIMYTVSESSSCGINLMKKSGYNIVVASVSCVVNFVGCILLVPLFGARGAALSVAISYVAFWLTRTLISERLFCIGARIGGTLMLIALMAVFCAYNTCNTFDIASLILYLSLMSALFLLYRDSVKDIMAVIKNKGTFARRG